MKNIFISIVAFLAFVMLACNDPYADSSYADASAELPAASYMLKNDSLNVSMWVELLNYTDLFNTMNLQASYTCFVPDNKAMQAYLQSKNLSSVSQLSQEDAKLLVRYHTIQGVKYNSIDFEDGLIADTTATGDYLSTSFDLNGKVVINSDATLKKTVLVTNAYLHVIDKVLTPVTETLWDKLQSEEYSILREAIVATGFKSKLESLFTLETNTTTGLTFVRKYRYTLLAVSNAVFATNGINSFDDLKNQLQAAPDYTSATNALNKYVAYHLLNQQVSYSELSRFADTDKVRSKNLNTLAPNQLINISDKEKTLYINYESADFPGAKLLVINRNCKNGVMHVIDYWLPVKSPKPTKIQWELTNYPELASIIPNYRVASGTNTYLYYLSNNYFACYTSLAVPESRSGLFYLLANKNDAVAKKSLYADYLGLSLGMFGWVEMQSPAIVAGKYNVYIEHYNPKRAATETGATGKLSFIVDGNYLGAQVTTIRASKTSDQFLKTLVGSITFTETTSHKLRILAGDNFESRLDCLTFEPIIE